MILRKVKPCDVWVDTIMTGTKPSAVAVLSHENVFTSTIGDRGAWGQGWGQIRFIKYKYKYKYIFFQSFKYKYKYKYTGKNLIKYKYKYKYSSSNTNTNTQWGRDKIAAILQMTYSNSWYCKKIVLFIQISLKIVSKGPISCNKPALVQIMAWCWVGNKP